MIKLENIVKKYGEKVIFDGLNLNFEKSKITAVLGESGVGKTTLLNILSDNTSYEGSVVGERDKISFVFQEDRLLPFKTLKQNLEFVLGKGEFSHYFKKFGLDGYEDKYPSALSGGMARRVALMRAFLYKSDIILMDEPFSGLDLGTKYKVMNVFYKEWTKDKRTVVMVTHGIDEAIFLADRLIVLSAGGKIVFDEKNNGEQTRKQLVDYFCK